MTTSFAPVVSAERLSVQVAQRLEAEIREGRLSPGEKLPTEAKLVELFKVSRTVVREALSRLKSIGLVESRQGSGVFVHHQAAFEPLHFDPRLADSLEAVLQIVEVRRALEAECAQLAATNRSAGDIDQLQLALAAIDRAVAEGKDGVEEDVLFHQAIAKAAGNPFLIGTLDFLAQFLRGGTQVTRANEARHAKLAQAVRQEHHAIATAIIQGDAKQANRAATVHMRNAAKRIQQADSSFWQQEGGLLAQVLIPKNQG
jgi:GntR family transcriptional repressor for pyruvate dehydrogenase complex